MNQTVRFQEILRRLAIIDEAFVEGQAGLGLDPEGLSALDLKTVALLQLAVLAAIGSSEGSLQWSTGRALAAGASEEEIAEVLLAIAPVVGLGRVASSAPGIAIGLEYDIDAALMESEGPVSLPSRPVPQLPADRGPALPASG